jgi:CopG antitoxin of type II toxin-antitoxin system
MSVPGVVKKWEDIPFFPNPKEEAAYWKEHQLDPTVMAGSLSRSEGQDSTTITLRMDPRMLSRLKRIAARRYLNYQSMMKQWIAERLEKELPGS